VNEKNGKYVADWREKSGRRRRKTFTSKHAALRFEAEQKELAHPKQKARGNQSPSSYAQPQRTGRMAIAMRQHEPSSSKPVASQPKASSRPTSLKRRRG
jgi:hypothetical protein